MSFITISYRGSFSKTLKLLRKSQMINAFLLRKMEKYGRMGVEALSAATPRRTGRTADSWGYEVHGDKDKIEIVWTNSNNNHGVYIAVLIQYGHGTRNGGYVQGIDYINPAMRPVFEEIAKSAWMEVMSNE